MKKIILTSVVALGVASGAFAQATLNWATASFAYITWETNTSVSPYFGGTGTGGTSGKTDTTVGNYYYELLYTTSGSGSVDSLAALSEWSDTGLSAENQAVAGRVQVIGSNAGAAVSGLNVNETYDIALVGWSANLGTTWSAALASLQSIGSWTGDAYFGVSSIGTVTPTSTTSPGATVFGGSGITSLNTPLYFVPVPEPTTIALAGLGAISLLALRRKK